MHSYKYFSILDRVAFKYSFVHHRIISKTFQHSSVYHIIAFKSFPDKDLVLYQK